MSSDPLARLEAFNNGGKSHAVTIDHPNGFGAGCWNLVLHGATGIGGTWADIFVHGVAFWGYGEDAPPMPDNVVYVGMIDYIADDGEEDERWPTLAECITAGLDRYEQLIERGKAGETLNLWRKEKEVAT